MVSYLICITLNVSIDPLAADLRPGKITNPKPSRTDRDWPMVVILLTIRRVLEEKSAR